MLAFWSLAETQKARPMTAKGHRAEVRDWGDFQITTEVNELIARQPAASQLG